jgi:hypothetical protein
MRLAAIPGELVPVLVVLVVHMLMLMRLGFVAVVMYVTLAQVQPHPDGHQQCRQPECGRGRLVQ